MKNAKRLLRKLDYLPRWAWYAMSLAIGGPVGPVVVYVAFHALQKAADDEDAEYDEWGAGSERREGGYADADFTVTDDLFPSFVSTESLTASSASATSVSDSPDVA